MEKDTALVTIKKSQIVGGGNRTFQKVFWKPSALDFV